MNSVKLQDKKKINMQKRMHFYTLTTNCLKKKKTSCIYNIIKEDNKILRNKFNEGYQSLYTENYNILRIETEEETNRKIYHVHGLEEYY